MGQRILRIKGTSSKVSEAKEKIEKMSFDIICTKVNIQQADVGRIIGQSGRKIQALQEPL